MDWKGFRRKISAFLLACQVTSEVTDQTGSLSAAVMDVVELGVSTVTLCPQLWRGW